MDHDKGMRNDRADIDCRRHGRPPYRVAILHGGPGARGDAEPVAREIATRRGVLEPLERSATIDGQVAELAETLRRHDARPFTVIGHSWGAWLGFLLAARQPERVRKLVLVASGPFTEEYAVGIAATRLARLDEASRRKVARLLEVLESPAGEATDNALGEFGSILARADAFDPMPDSTDVDIRGDIHRGVWSEAARLRASGELLGMAPAIRCPVVAIHGDYDPHPAEGVRAPLAAGLRDFRFERLAHCGHKPWVERQARNAFFELLERELGDID